MVFVYFDKFHFYLRVYFKIVDHIENAVVVVDSFIEFALKERMQLYYDSIYTIY